MKNHRLLSIILGVVIVILIWHLLTVLMANLTMLLLVALVGAGCRYWGTKITPAEDLHRLRTALHNHRQIDPPES